MILVLRALGVGDLATSVPALRGLRAAFPDRELVLAAPDWLIPLVDLIGGIDRVLPTDNLDGAGWPGIRPQWAVNLHGRGPRSHRLLGASGPERLCGFRCPEAGHADGPPWNDHEHEVRRWCRLLRWYGVDADPADLTLRRPVPDRVPVGVTIVHPGGKDPARRWSVERFGTLADALARSGHRVVVTGSAGERGLAEEVAHRAGLAGTAVLAGRLELAGLAALVGYARLVVSADTGIAHLATAYRTPSVVLFGPVRPERWGPPPDRPWHRVLWLATADRNGPAEAGGRGVPAEAGGRASAGGFADRVRALPLHPALAAISVEEVLDAVAMVDRPEWAERAAAA